MSDLISRKETYNELIESIDWLRERDYELYCVIGDSIRVCLDEQPTAYDVDKVVEELKERKHEICLSDDDLEHYQNGIDEAIEIVKQEAEKFGRDTNVGSKGNDVLEFANLLKELCCKKDEDYDNPVISPKYLNDTIENLLLDFNEQYNNGWIPCSERLPEEAFGCLVTVMDCEPSTQTDFENILPYFVGYDGETWNDADGKEIPFEVIAWMPLPKPYKESDRYVKH